MEEIIANNTEMYGALVTAQYARLHHRHHCRDNQCTSVLIEYKYKPFVIRCIVNGYPEISSLREVNVKSGLPATTSTERLEQLDDDDEDIIGGDHRLKNYSSILTVLPEMISGRSGTVVIESFVVDVPQGNTKDDTCYFVESLIKCNLKSLASVAEKLAAQNITNPMATTF